MSQENENEEEPEQTKTNKVVMLREVQKKRNYGRVSERKNKKHKKCLFCKNKGNMLSYEGKYFCINCYNALMEKV